MSTLNVIIIAAITCCAYHIGEGIVKEIAYQIEKRKKAKKEDR